jgi:triphosphatase
LTYTLAFAPCYARVVPIERELKLTGTLPNLDQVSHIAGVTLRFERTEHQVNTYFDTPDLQLRQRKMSLRLRRILGSSSVFTLKGSSVVQNGWHSKEELEVDAHGATSILDLRDAEMLARLEDVPLMNLEPICVFETERRIYVLEGVGELSLDRVRIKRGEAVIESFEELELEVKDDVSEEQLERVSMTLRGMSGLEPSALSKSARALKALGVI